jgi:hypothetical protein
MSTNRGSGEVSAWELVGIEDGDGEFHEIPTGGGQVLMMETATDRGVGPPPD